MNAARQVLSVTLPDKTILLHMKHPTKAPGGWKLEYIVYPGGPGEIAVAVLRLDRFVRTGRRKPVRRKVTHRMMGLRWCEGKGRIGTWQKGAQDWFVLPFTFAGAISRSLLQMKATGFPGFDEAGLQKLVEWMTDYGQQAVDDCLCY